MPAADDERYDGPAVSSGDAVSQPHRGWHAYRVAVGALLLLGALVLPYRVVSVFGLATGALALLVMGSGLLSYRGHAQAGRAAEVLRLFAAGYLLWLLCAGALSAWEISRLYGGLGRGLGLLLVGATLLVALLLGPVVLAGQQLAWTAAERRRLAALTVAVLTGAVYCHVRDEGVTVRHSTGVAGSVKSALASLALEPGSRRAERPIRSRHPARCDAPFERVQASVIVALASKRRPICLQGEEAKVMASLAALARGDQALKIDWIVTTQGLRESSTPWGGLVDALKLRPGLDGVCHRQRCLMPWQLTSASVFGAGTPLSFAKQWHAGFSLKRVRRAFGLKRLKLEQLERIETRSFFLRGATLTELQQQRALDEVTAVAGQLERAQQDAQRFVLGSQDGRGRFRYELNFATGKARWGTPSLPRHAGTLGVLCEQGHPDGDFEKAVARGLEHLASFAEVSGPLAGLKRPGRTGSSLGELALGLTAFLRCREHVGATYDSLIAGLGRSLLALLAQDGHFNPSLKLQGGRVSLGPSPLYAGGQSILALGLLEAVVEAEPEALGHWPTLHASLERAMDHVADGYWPSFARELFFLGENWHCIAAAALLKSHPHQRYQDFCLDYVAFKSRFILGPEDGAPARLWGAMGFGNVFPPHTGSTAGLGEALGGALLIGEARGKPLAAGRVQMRRLGAFLVRQQLSADACFFCSPDGFGGFTGDQVAVTGRIDHTQHAWSAIAHAARAATL